ncbi:unnamed protein product [Spirodela intermedia]|uniref:Uncharacterized protein n=1 Tax=Spirodela intermedia TaxID=51605 RepID=A0A7I8IBG7_SPIIN|nr:unnamed protein product [Spirodela intermedia]CAA6654928.1 unnamed protein product [Spirodela intermedia]
MEARESEEVAPLVVTASAAPAEDRSLPQASRRENHARDVHILSFGFLFVFSAYSAAQNLESTVNTEDDLGTTSLGILYLSFTFFSLTASSMVKFLGSKNALVLGSTGYWLFIASNLKPCWYTMVPASLYLGYAASIIWVGQGTYLTSAARSHAKDCHLQEGKVIGNFNGEFWGMFASTQVVGNLVSLALLGGGKDGEGFTGATLLFSVFLASMTLGTVLLCFLHKRDDREEPLSEPSATDDHSSVKSMLRSAVAPLLDKKMLLLVPLLVYSGCNRHMSELTKHVIAPAFGVSGVGGAMAIYGACDAVCSFVAGRFTSGLPSITLTVSSGSFLQMLALLWLLLKHGQLSLPPSLSLLSSGELGYVYPLLIAAVWGVGDGVFNTQLNAILALLFRRNMEAAFAQLKVWQSASTAVVFFLSPHISFQAMSLVMLFSLFLSLLSFLFLALRVERVFALRS